MARLEDVLPAFRSGKMIRRRDSFTGDFQGFPFTANQILANDWEIVPEPLAPCPWRYPAFSETGTRLGKDGGLQVYCRRCQACGPESDCSNIADNARELWNRRKQGGESK